MNSKVILAILVVAVVAIGGYFLLSNQSGNNGSQNQDGQTTTATPTEAVMTQEETAVTVTADGYEPKSVTIKTGGRVVWTNKSGGPVTVNSDAHPTHLLYPFLNLGKFDDGSSVSVTFDKAGTYTYHNHLDASMTGTVVVE